MLEEEVGYPSTQEVDPLLLALANFEDSVDTSKHVLYQVTAENVTFALNM